MTAKVTPVGALARGLLAGAIGTAAMTAWQELSSRLQGSGGKGEAAGDGGSQPHDPWERASAPAQVGRRIVEGVFQRDAPPELIPVFTHGMHWLYGTGWGAAYGLVAGSAGPDHPLRRGALFGTAVWSASYLQLVPMGLYEPPWKYGVGQLALDLSYHLVYGASVGLGYRALDHG